jgi:hypothetical protein
MALILQEWQWMVLKVPPLYNATLIFHGDFKKSFNDPLVLTIPTEELLKHVKTIIVAI